LIIKTRRRVKMTIYITILILTVALVTFDILVDLPGRRVISGVSVIAAVGLSSWYFYAHKALLEEFESGKRILCVRESGKFVVSKARGYEYHRGYFIDAKGEAIDEDYCQSLE
jgi:hypothetical protein